MGFEPSVALTEFLYSGEQFDSKIGQQYLRQRYYDPATGRFNGLDPFFGNLDDPQSLHKYLYTHADPVNGIDPNGKSSIFYLLTSLLDAQVTVSGNKSVKPVDLIEIDEKWSDNSHATVILWINVDGAPSIFNFSNVQKKILEIFENTKIKVLVIKTSQTREQMQDQLGPQYDRSLHITNYPWYTAKGGPLGWILGGINIP
jgi:RHS repeat-associated protein